MMRMAIIIFLNLWFLHSAAQVQLRADRTDVLIGDHVELTLEIPQVEMSQWTNPGVMPPDTMKNLMVLGEPEISQPSPGAPITKSWRVAIFDTGRVIIPALRVEIGNGDATRVLYSNDLPINVQGVVDSTGLAPIKEIRYEPATFSDYLPYILAVIGIISVIIIFRYLRNRPSKESVVEEIRDVRPAHQIALDALYALEQEKLWQSGQIKKYHSRLSFVLREYIEERFGVPALESTTSELRVALRGTLEPTHYDEMMEMMSIEDLVKFAKARPPVDVHDRYLQFVRKFVQSTRIVQEVATADD